MQNPRSLALFGLALITAAASAQQKVQWNSKYNIPVAPTGLAARPLPDHPLEFDTAEGQNIRVVVLTKGLEYPFCLAFLPDGSMLVTERPGRLRIIRNGVLDPKPFAGAPPPFGAENRATRALSTATWTSFFIRVSPRITSSISPTPSRSMAANELRPSRADAGMAACSPM